MERLIAAGRSLAVCTRAADGAVALAADGRWLEVAAEPVDRVVDSNGAGDAFLAGVIVGQFRGLSIDPSLRVGARVAAMSPREREVLELMAEGKSNQAIAEKMVITLRAVEKHVTSIFSKLRLPATAEDHRRVLAVLTYLGSSD